jgi:D-hexose-6-phosphate mutarotase
VRVLGLEGARYRDNADGGKLKTQDGAVTIAGETVRLFDDAPDAAVIEDTGLGRRIRISRSGGRSTVVWNPADTASAIADIAAGGQWRFVCVESGNIGAAAKTIAPAASAALGIRYRVEAL